MTAAWRRPTRPSPTTRSRPLFIYVNPAKAAENPALASFVDFYLDDAIDSVSSVGYVDLADEDIDATRERWTARTAGAA